MRILTVLNRDGGTLKSTDLTRYRSHLQSVFERAGHDFECRIVTGAQIVAALEEAGADDAVEGIVAGGGDGTVSAAAGIAWKAGKPLGVLPAGTLNLFARSLGLPLDIHEAATALAVGRVAECDIASVNGRPFVHQFSVGVQSRVVKQRDARDHGSRLEKVLAGVRAAIAVFWRPPSFPVRVSLDGGARSEERLSTIVLSNNPFAEGHLPYADRLDGAKLGVYRAGVLSAQANMKLAADLVIGAWNTNPDLRIESARSAELEFPKLKRNATAVIDGELVPLERHCKIEIHPGELKVMAPGKQA